MANSPVIAKLAKASRGINYKLFLWIATLVTLARNDSNLPQMPNLLKNQHLGLKIQCLRLKILAQTLKIRLFVKTFKLCYAVFYRSSGDCRAYSSFNALVKGLWYDIIHAKFKHFARIHLL